MSKSVVFGTMAMKLESSFSQMQSNKFIPVGMRKEIKGFSKSAKRNFLWAMQTVNFEELYMRGWKAFFITLTYQYSTEEGKEDFYFTHKGNIEVVKKDLKLFFKRLGYFFGKLKVDWFCFWKLEFFEKAPVPHYHLLLFVAPHDNITDEFLRVYIPNEWVDTITNKTGVSIELKERMKRVSTNVSETELDRSQILQVYMSKEIGKEYQTNYKGKTGRFWGIENREIYKRFKVEDRYVIPDKVFYRVRRDLAKYKRKKGYKVKIRGDYGIRGYYLNSDEFFRLVNYYMVSYGYEPLEVNGS